MFKNKYSHFFSNIFNDKVFIPHLHILHFSPQQKIKDQHQNIINLNKQKKSIIF